MKKKIKWRMSCLTLLLLVSAYFLLPNFVDSRFLLSEKKINLGLDLKGGSDILMQADFKSYTRDKLYQLSDEIKESLSQNKLQYTKLAVDDGGMFLVLQTVESSVKQIVQEVQKLNNVEVTKQKDKILISYSSKYFKLLYDDVIAESIDNVRRRLDKSGTKEIVIQRQGKDKISLQIPGITNLEQVRSLLGRTAKLTFHLLGEDSKNIDHVTTMILQDSRGHSYPVLRKVELSGDSLINARSGMNSLGQPVVYFKFNSTASKKFAKLTRENVGQPFAIVLDNYVITAPRIREPILAGQGEISGSFTGEQADELSVLLRAGALPAPLRIVEERTVGPSLGAESIKHGKIAALSAIIIVSSFMIVAYGLLGFLATIALFCNIILILLVLTLLQSTLTLPGIAGIALTFGMSVDANVLIFERIREELRAGKKIKHSVELGFKNATSTILDSNITTIIAAAIMYVIGSGPISGFAVTLSIGILCSMFSAIVITKLLIQVLIYFFKLEKITL